MKEALEYHEWLKSNIKAYKWNKAIDYKWNKDIDKTIENRHRSEQIVKIFKQKVKEYKKNV